MSDQSGDSVLEPPVGLPPAPATFPSPVLQPPSTPATQDTAALIAIKQDQPVSGGRMVLGVVGNIVWLLIAGIWMALYYVIAGVILCITIIGIPFGIQAFKLSGYALWPFNRVVVRNDSRDAGLSLLGNVIWFLLVGWAAALGYLFLALLFVLTIVGAPLALAALKMAGLALAPFGKKVVPRSSLNSSATAVVVSSIG
jgi:uncharacterized membrane protein YccF (DUF307 family)